MNASFHRGGTLSKLFVSVFVGVITVAVQQAAVHAGLIVRVKPIHICKGDGSDCANDAENLYSAETNKIWAQAGISIKFLPFASIKSNKYHTLDNQGEVDDLFADAPAASTNGNVISMWFVDNHFDAWGEVNAIASNKLVVDDGIFDIDRIDTIAHEIGHLLGLKHDDPGVEKDFLMRSGGDRMIPGDIDDITPDGAKLDKLTNAQVTTAKGDGKVMNVPEPGPLTFMVCGVGLVLVRRMRREVTDA